MVKLRKTRKNSVKLGNNGKIGQSETKHGITRSNKFKLGQKRWKVKTNLFKIGKKNKKNKTKQKKRTGGGTGCWRATAPSRRATAPPMSRSSVSWAALCSGNLQWRSRPAGTCAGATCAACAA